MSDYNKSQKNKKDRESRMIMVPHGALEIIKKLIKHAVTHFLKSIITAVERKKIILEHDSRHFVL